MSSTASAACWAPTIERAEREHRPIGDDDADLRQHVDADEPAGEIEGELGQPERERGAEIGAELEFVSDREHVRHVAGRPGIEQRRHQRPQQRLRERRQPDRQRRARSQQFDEDGDVKHQPRTLLPSASRHEIRARRRRLEQATSGQVEPMASCRHRQHRHSRPPPGRRSGDDEWSVRAVPAHRNARARCSPCDARSRSRDGGGPVASSAGRG